MTQGARAAVSGRGMPLRFREAHNANRGRHLVAAVALQPGDVIVVQEPYAAVQYDEQQEVVCDYTFRHSAELLSCGACKLVRCSRHNLLQACCCTFVQ